LFCRDDFISAFTSLTSPVFSVETSSLTFSPCPFFVQVLRFYCVFFPLLTLVVVIGQSYKENFVCTHYMMPI
jgi:hypothetical protein